MWFRSDHITCTTVAKRPRAAKQKVAGGLPCSVKGENQDIFFLVEKIPVFLKVVSINHLGPK